MHSPGPTPVDAQTVLHRAAAIGPGPNVASHAMYTLSSGSDLGGTADVWIGCDKTEIATQLSLSETMRQNGATVPDLSANISAAGQSLLQVYDPTNTSAAVPSFRGAAAGPGQALEGMLVGTLLAQKMSARPNAYTLRRSTLDGVPVYALTLATPASQTYYFSAPSYMLVGVDWVQDGKSWQARLDASADQLVTALQVPVQSALDGQVRSGAITAGEESTDLASLRTQLTHVVTSGIGMRLSESAPNLPQP